MTPQREIHWHYADPLDLVWLRTAGLLGMKVQRSGEVYAWADGLDDALRATARMARP